MKPNGRLAFGGLVNGEGLDAAEAADYEPDGRSRTSGSLDVEALEDGDPKDEGGRMKDEAERGTDRLSVG
jgi:hypothetical protein